MPGFSYIKDPGELKRLLLERGSIEVGGVECLIAGGQGCGKTTTLCQISIENMERYGDVIIWRGSEDCQWTLFLNAKKEINYLPKSDLEIEFFSRKTGKTENILDYIAKVNPWSDIHELIDKLDPERINVIEMAPMNMLNTRQYMEFVLSWLDFFEKLIKRRTGRPVSVYFDEFEDFVPEYPMKELFVIDRMISYCIRGFRKNDISLFAAVHNINDVYHLARKKMRWKMYMRGSRALKGSRITINLNDLEIGTAVLESGKFERFKWRPLGRERGLRAIIRKKATEKPAEPGAPRDFWGDV